MVSDPLFYSSTSCLFVYGSLLEGIDLRGEEKKYKREVRGNLFTQRVVCTWNELPWEVVEADRILTFKRHLVTWERF